MPKPRTPSELGPAGRSLWSVIWSGFSTEDPRELHAIRQACRLEDDVVRLREQLSGEPLIVQGSTGQPVESPLLGAIRNATALQSRLLAGLVVDTEAAGRSTAGRKLVAHRWAS